ncbi:unnamed protein product, partial [Pylaiella littoralis]
EGETPNLDKRPQCVGGRVQDSAGGDCIALPMLHHQSRGGGVVQLLRGRAEKCHRHQARVPESKISDCKTARESPVLHCRVVG